MRRFLTNTALASLALLATTQDALTETKDQQQADALRKYLKENFGQPAMQTSWYPQIAGLAVEGEAGERRQDNRGHRCRTLQRDSHEDDSRFRRHSAAEGHLAEVLVESEKDATLSLGSGQDELICETWVICHDPADVET